MLTRRHLLGALPLLRPTPAPAAEPAPTAEPGPPLEALLAQLAAIPERRAAFREHRRFAAIEGTLESTGHLLLRRGRMEKVTDWPQPERLEVEGDRVAITAGNDPPRVIDMDRVPELRVLIDAIRGPLLGDVAAVTRAFSARTEGTLRSWTLHLTPKDPAAARLLRRVQLEGTGSEPRRLTLVQANGDTQDMDILPP